MFRPNFAGPTTYQPADFGHVYAVYGGMFIVGALVWSFAIDRVRPDLPTLIGAALALLGAGLLRLLRLKGPGVAASR